MSPRLAIFTVCSNNYLPHARTLFASVQAQHPEADLFLCLADRPMQASHDQAWTTIAASDLEIADFPSFAFSYGIMEFNTAVKPFMFLHLLENLGYDAVLYFDPDIQLYARLDDELAMLHGGASFVLTPHILQPLESTEAPDDITIMRSGIYNLGFLGAARGTESEDVLQWWARRVRYQCLDAKAEGLFVDQKFIDLVPGFAPNCHISHNAGLNVAYWNLTQRAITKSGDGWHANNHKLVFFHFSGFDPRRPAELSKHTTRFRYKELAPVRELVAHYQSQLRKHGFDKAIATPYGYGSFASGAPIHDHVRRMFREAPAAWDGNPFETYEAYLHQPSPGVARHPAGYIATNFMVYLRNVTPRLKKSCDLKRAGCVRDLAVWYVLCSGREVSLGPDMIAPVIKGLEHHGVDVLRLPKPGSMMDTAPREGGLLSAPARKLRRWLAPYGSRRESVLRAGFARISQRTSRPAAPRSLYFCLED